MDIYKKLEDFYHRKTLESNWVADCGNGNKKLDEIYIFLKYLKNENVSIDNIATFDHNLSYKEAEVEEPGDLKYLGAVYQITHGNTKNYFDFQINKNYQIKNQEKGLPMEAAVISASDVALDDEDRLKVFFKDLAEKEKSADHGITLLVRYEYREKPESNLKISSKWKDIVCVFDDGNLSIKS